VVAEQYAPAQNESRDPGAGEALAQTLEKIVTQIEIINQTLQVLDHRISQNERNVSVAVEEFRHYREERSHAAPAMSFNAQHILDE
jgi:predicted nucleic acid-binding protein